MIKRILIWAMTILYKLFGRKYIPKQEDITKSILRNTVMVAKKGKVHLYHANQEGLRLANSHLNCVTFVVAVEALDIKKQRQSFAAWMKDYVKKTR